MAASSAAGAFCSGSAGIAVHDCTVTVAICGHFGRKIAFQDARLLGSRRISERVGHLGFRFGVHVSPGTSLTTLASKGMQVATVGAITGPTRKNTRSASHRLPKRKVPSHHVHSSIPLRTPVPTQQAYLCYD